MKRVGIVQLRNKVEALQKEGMPVRLNQNPATGLRVRFGSKDEWSRPDTESPYDLTSTQLAFWLDAFAAGWRAAKKSKESNETQTT